MAIKFEVQTAVSLLQDLYDRSQKGEFSSEEARKRGADLVRNLRYNKDGYFWVDTDKGINVVLPTDTDKKIEGTNRFDAKDIKGNFYVHDFISNGAATDGGYTDYWFIKLGQTEPMPKRSYTLAFKPFGWVLGTGNYIDDIDSAVLKYKQEADKKNAQIFTVMLIAIAASLAIAIGLSFIFGLKLSKPIIRVTELINRTSKFDLVYDKSFESLSKSKDETGTMAKAILQMRDTLRKMAGSMISVSNTLALHAREMSSTSDENLRTLNQIVRTISEIAEGNNIQAEMISNANAKITDVAKTIDEINTATIENAESTSKSLEMVIEGGNAVNLQSDRMTENINISSKVGDSIRELSTMIEKVGSIVGVINSIASQTNLLALNAAIEAARAGEAGKGFAVVSEEIRKLAEGSSSAAKEITQIVNQTISNSKSAVDSIEMSKKVVNSQEEALSVTKGAFGNIKNSVEDIAVKTKQTAKKLVRIDSLAKEISSQSHDMAAVAQESAASTEEISATSQEQLASFELIAKASGDLSSMAEELSREMNKFKI